MTERQQLMQEFATKYGLALGEQEEGPNRFDVVLIPGLDPGYHGWVLAAGDEPDRVLYVPHVDDFHSDDAEGLRRQMDQNGFPEPEVVLLYGTDLEVSLDTLRRMIETGIDPLGRRIEDNISSWDPRSTETKENKMDTIFIPTCNDTETMILGLFKGLDEARARAKEHAVSWLNEQGIQEPDEDEIKEFMKNNEYVILEAPIGPCAFRFEDGTPSGWTEHDA